MKRCTVVLICLFSLVSTALFSFNNVTTYKSSKVIANSIIVIKDQQNPNFTSSLNSLNVRFAAQINFSIPEKGIEEWQISGDFETALDAINSIPGVTAIPNYVFDWNGPKPEIMDDLLFVHGNTPNDPYFYRQWSFNNDGTFSYAAMPGADISLLDAWDISKGDTNVIVAVFDTGIDFNHEDLSGNIWTNFNEIPDNNIDDDGNGYVDDIHGWNSVDNNNDVHDGIGHGTHVAGTIGAVTNNGIGLAGINQQVRILSVKVFNDDDESSMIGFIRGYHYLSTLYKEGFKIVAVNQSWGGIRLLETFPSHKIFVDLMTSFAREHHEFGMLWVVSAGNDASDTNEYPYYSIPNNIPSPNILVVGATDYSDQACSFTNFSRKSVDIGAPGYYIASTYPNDRYTYMSGTSMAAPHVTGAVALAKARFQDENDLALFARVQAASDRFPQFSDLWMNSGRLNAAAALVPRNSLSGLIPNVGTLQLIYSNYDSFAVQTAGFINSTLNPVDVRKIAVEGEDAALFSLYESFAPISVPMNGAFGAAIQFKGDGTKDQYTANLVITTSAGDVAIPMIGEMDGFAQISITPESHDFGVVQYGDVLSTSFTIQNQGSGDLDYNIQTDIISENDYFSTKLASLSPYVSTTRPPQKTPIDYKKNLESHVQEIGALLRGKERPYITFEESKPLGGESRVLWSDDLNDAARVSKDWMVLNAGDGDSWQLVDIGTDGETDNVFLAGDLEYGYSNNTFTAAVSPLFNFSSLKETNEGPQFLEFDFASLLEEGWDYCYVVAIHKYSSILDIVFDSYKEYPNDGEVYTIMADIQSVAGLDSVAFCFIADYDDIYVEGWGSLFDNVKIWVGEPPLELSTYGGVIPAGGEEQVEITLRTEYWDEGDYYIYSDIYSNAINADPYSWMESLVSHQIHFNNAVGYLEIDPEESQFGEIYRNETKKQKLNLSNLGITDVDYETYLYFKKTNIGTLSALESWSPAVQTLTAADQNSASSLSALSQRKKKLEAFTASLVPSAVSNTTNSLNPATLFKSVPTETGSLPYFEDFEANGDLPADWIIDDASFGMGMVWQIANTGSSDSSDYAMVFGDLDSLAYGNDSETYAVSPQFDLSGLSDSLDIYLEFDYLFAFKDMSDHFDVWLGVMSEIPGETPQYSLLATSDDGSISNSGSMDKVAMNISSFQGERVFLVFGVTTSWTGNSGCVLFDNVSLYTTSKDVYATPMEGTVGVGETGSMEIVMNTRKLKPGGYRVFTYLLYSYLFKNDFCGKIGRQVTEFSVVNRPPVAGTDTLSIVSGDYISLDDLTALALANDSDPDQDAVQITKIFDPYYGALKSLSSEVSGSESGQYYAAPLNFDGYDQLKYTLSDGYDTQEGTVWIQVFSKPRFVPGVQQEYTFFEDDSLVLNTMLMAAGVGGMDKDLFVWSGSKLSLLSITSDQSKKQLLIKTAAPDSYGQEAATLYVGHGEDVLDSLRVAFVVVSVNDYPVAGFTYAIHQKSVSFTDGSHDRKDVNGSIVSWHWDFGDGSSSDETNPVHEYDSEGVFTVTLTVTDNEGLETSVSEEVDLLATGILADYSSIPTAYRLSANYPNPFNPTTTIPFALPKASDVSMIVYNAQGKAVKTLIEGRMQPGSYKAQLDGTEFPSGVYFVRLIAGDFHQTQKMILIK